MGDSSTDPLTLLQMRNQISCARADPSLQLHAKFHNVFIVSASFDIWGLLYRSHFTDDGPIQCAITDPRYTLTCQILSRSVYSAPSGGERPQFCRFWTSAFSGVDIWQQSEKDEGGCTTTNLPLSNGIKIVTFCTPTPSWRNRAHNF